MRQKNHWTFLGTVALIFIALLVAAKMYLVDTGKRQDRGQVTRPMLEMSLPKMPARDGYEGYSENIMIASQNKGATAAGLEIAKMGGNIADVATAVAFAIAVERPQSTGLGGGGFTLLHMADSQKTVALDYREQAPLRSKAEMFQDGQGNVVEGLSQDGILAAGVPGLVAGTLKMHTDFGLLSRKKVMAPAIKLARAGFQVYPHLHNGIVKRRDVLMTFPASAAVFLDQNSNPLEVGAVLKQPDLAKTLEQIAAGGSDVFYRGNVAKKIVAENKRLGGLIHKEDLASYRVRLREPLQGTFNGYDVLTMPPASSGGIHLVQILNMLENKGLKSMGAGSPTAIHLTAAATQIAFADRYKFLGDSDFVEVPVTKLVSKGYAQRRMDEIDESKARASSEVVPGLNLSKAPDETNDTTSFAVMDKDGNAVVSIQSVNGLLGSGVVVPGTGFLLNNHMDDFETKPEAANMWGVSGLGKNSIEPKKRPLSSMTPTMLFKDGRPAMVLGTPAGSRIISCIAQTILNYAEYDMSLFDSVASVRYHHQWSPDVLFHAIPYLSDSQIGELEKMGYKTSKIESQSWTCKVGAIAFEKSKLHGVCDTRDTGSCKGY